MQSTTPTDGILTFAGRVLEANPFPELDVFCLTLECNSFSKRDRFSGNSGFEKDLFDFLISIGY